MSQCIRSILGTPSLNMQPYLSRDAVLLDQLLVIGPIFFCESSSGSNGFTVRWLYVLVSAYHYGTVGMVYHIVTDAAQDCTPQRSETT